MTPETRYLLKILNFIAKAMPFLAKLIEKITEALLTETMSSESSEEIIRQRLQAEEHTDTARQEPPSTDLPPEETLKNESKTRTVPSAIEQKVEAQEHKDKGQQKPTEVTDTSILAQEIQLKQIEQDFTDVRERDQKKLERVVRQEAIVFYFLLLFALVSLAFIIWGGYLFIGKGLNLVSALTGFLGLIGGVGSIILRNLHKNLQQNRTTIEKRQEEQTKYSRSIQTALALTGSEREKQLAETARWLRRESES